MRPVVIVDPPRADPGVVAELGALGVKPPATTPIFYRASAARLTIADSIEVLGEASSGEGEFVLLQQDGRLWVGAGSDHTDRKVETYSVTVSKQMCDKPIAPVLWELEEVIDHWDRMILRAYACIKGKRELYQQGTLDAMLPVSELIARGFEGGKLPDGCAMFGGTFAAIGGIRVSEPQLISIGVALTAIVATALLLAKTGFGRAVRALADSVELASIAGVDVDRMIVSIWILVGMLAGLCGACASACWFLALGLAPAAPVRAVGVIEAPMAALAGRRFFAEKLHARQILAGLAVIAGVVMTTLR